MTVGIIGAGRIAQSLGRLLYRRGASVVALASRNQEAAEKASSFIGANVQALCLAELASRADHLLIAVTDGALPEVAAQLSRLGFGGATVLHTSGNAGPGALQPLASCGIAVGVLHPLQTVPTPEAGLHSLPGSFFGVGGVDQARNWATALVALLHGRAVHIAPDAWPLYHAAAVMASNYQSALIDSALELLDLAGVPRDIALSALAPIVRSAMDNVLSAGPVAALTGPIQRGDAGTVRAHLVSLAKSEPETRQLYAAAGLRTLSVAQKQGLPQTAAAAVRATLKGTPQ
jgi:predicted short-subunit dehydrogenase-like oxidoreductase (DUF2520 family)